MKEKWIAQIILLLVLALGLVTACLMKRNGKERIIKHIDLPEKAFLISKDSSRPDTLTAYISGDSLILRFKY